MSPRIDWAWSVRRELWENRGLWMAPLVIASLALGAAVWHSPRFAARMRMIEELPARDQVVAVVVQYGMTAGAILFISWIAALFYALDALNGERRDRSILFWKSMPVSDTTTVIAKASIPLLVVPLIACTMALATQALMLLMHTVVLYAKGIDPGLLWSRLPFFGMPVGMFYGMFAHALWFAPIFGYLLLVSVLAPRAPFLWAFVPFFAVFVVETLTFGTGHLMDFIRTRLYGGMSAFKPEALKQPITELSQLDPVRFFSQPGLWLGLLAAAAFIAAAIRLRRYRDPN